MRPAKDSSAVEKSYHHMIEAFPVENTELKLEKGDLGRSLIDGYKIIFLDGKGFTLKFYWKEPLTISSGVEPDVILIQIQMSEFMDAEGLQLPASIVKFVQIPAQMGDETEIENVENTGSLNADAVKTLILGSLVLNLFIGGPLDKIWGLFESLQIVHLIRLFDTRTPGNVNIFTFFFEEITGQKFVDNWLTKYFYIPEQEPFSLNFQNAGYGNILIIENAQAHIYNWTV